MALTVASPQDAPDARSEHPLPVECDTLRLGDPNRTLTRPQDDERGDFRQDIDEVKHVMPKRLLGKEPEKVERKDRHNHAHEAEDQPAEQERSRQPVRVAKTTPWRLRPK